MHCADRPTFAHRRLRRACAQAGSAIVLALITVLLAASVASSIILSVSRGIDAATGLQDQAQARELARGATDWARNVLADDARRTQVDHLHETWAIKIPPTPVDQAEVAGEIREYSGRFNINNLAPGTVANPLALQQFARLLEAVGEVSAGEAETLAARVQNEIAVPSGGLAPRGPLVDPGELLDIDGFDAELLDRLRPYVAALPAPSRLNVNTASAEVLHAIIDQLSLAAARVLVAERERAWYRSIADFESRLPSGARLDNHDGIDVRSRFFAVVWRARAGVAMVSMTVMLDRSQGNWASILWQKIE